MLGMSLVARRIQKRSKLMYVRLICLIMLITMRRDLPVKASEQDSYQKEWSAPGERLASTEYHLISMSSTSV